MSYSAMFSPSVLPVTVGQSRCKQARPAAARRCRGSCGCRRRCGRPGCGSGWLGATLQMFGVLRLSSLIRWMSYSTPASRAMASMCSTVFVLPPMAMSRIIELSTDACGADLAGQQAVALAELVELEDHFDDPPGGPLVELLPLGAGGQERAVARQGHAQGLAQAVHAVGREHARARAARRASGLLERRAARRPRSSCSAGRPRR